MARTSKRRKLAKLAKLALLAQLAEDIEKNEERQARLWVRDWIARRQDTIPLVQVLYLQTLKLYTGVSLSGLSPISSTFYLTLYWAKKTCYYRVS